MLSAEETINRIEAILARRPTLDSEPTLPDKVWKCVTTASRVDRLQSDLDRLQSDFDLLARHRDKLSEAVNKLHGELDGANARLAEAVEVTEAFVSGPCDDSISKLIDSARITLTRVRALAETTGETP